MSEAATADDELQISQVEKFFCTQLNASETSEFLLNILFNVGGYLVSKLVNKPHVYPLKTASTLNSIDQHQAMITVQQDIILPAAAFTLFENNLGLITPSQSVYHVVAYSEKILNRKCLLTLTKPRGKVNIKKHWSCITMDNNHKVFNDHVVDENQRSMLISRKIYHHAIVHLQQTIQRQRDLERTARHKTTTYEVDLVKPSINYAPTFLTFQMF